ncbi:B3 domain-containing protein At4g34400-like [Coffea eugenioides]|uniref:B3 domain-containing protein At4g34400-like n=1 Tax=Coffea eugenioides TaxID=49369 RepID=UPI000F60950A|nr:B3 domain-containing protein At4g34400-like [Coffea eugenioides]
MESSRMHDNQRLRAFFKFFIPDSSKERMKIPSAFTSYLKAKLSPRAYLRDRFGNKWPVRVGRIGDDFFFLDGWAEFVEENSVELGDFLVFQYDGHSLYDVKLLGHSACEKKGVGALKVLKHEEEEQMEEACEVKEVEGEEEEEADEANEVKKEEQEEDNWEKEEEEGEEETNEDKQGEMEESNNSLEVNEAETEGEKEQDADEIEQKKEGEGEINEDKQEKEMGKCYSNTIETEANSDYMMEAEDDSTQKEEEGNVEEEPAAKTHSKVATVDSKSSSKGKKKIRGGKHESKAVKGHKRRRRWLIDPYGYDLFKSGCISQPKNPYFVTQKRARRQDALYVPHDILRDHNLKLPQEIILVDQQGREWTSTRNHWKDGRFWYHGGWSSLCRVNIVGFDDICICEFKRKVGGGLYIEVQILHPQDI